MAASRNDPREVLAGIRRTLEQGRARQAERERVERLAAAERARDAQVFRSAVADATAMPVSDRVQARPAVAPPRARRAAAEVVPAPVAALSDGIDGAAAGDNHARFARDGISSQTLRKLRRGGWPVQGALDLHGMTRDAARTAIAGFLGDAQARGWRCVRIVPGKGLGSAGGTPVLRTLAARWLAQSPGVLAFTQANQSEGGSGALVVLLRTA